MLDTHLPELDQGNRRYSDLCAAGSNAILLIRWIRYVHRRCRKVLQAKLLMRGFQEMSKVANARNSLFHFQNSTLRITPNLWELDR